MLSINYQSTGEAGKMNLPKGKQFGLIAQDVETVFPELVKDEVNVIMPDLKKNPDGLKQEIKYKGVNYIGLIPILTQAIKEQQLQINDLRRQIKELKGLVISKQ